MTPSVLLVDDEPSIQHAFRRALRDDQLDVHVASTALQAEAEMNSLRPDVVVLDVHLPDADGLVAFDRLRAIDARTPIILITGHGTTDLAIEAIKRGAYEYLLKPLDLATLRDLIRQACAISRRMHVRAVLPEEPAPSEEGDRLVGRCPAMQAVYKQIGRVAAQDVTVLIQGESGTGKELVARAIYQHSHRADKPFLAINCAAIPENLLESELFGHERGAFTGADRKRIGKFEQCHGGTILLDEVGEMPPLTQVRMLRLLQDQTFQRVGGNETITTDVRIIAATNADLDRLAAEGKFRSDLHFRLNVFKIHLPPLRERGDDLELLLDHYLKRYGRELGRPVELVAPDALEALRNRTWPGNVRELQSLVKQILLQSSGPVVSLASVPPGLLAAPPAGGGEPAATDPFGSAWSRFVDEHIAAGSVNLHAEAVEAMEREVIMRVLRRTAGNQLQAAKILGMSRASLRSRIRGLKINIGRTVDLEEEEVE